MFKNILNIFSINLKEKGGSKCFFYILWLIPAAATCSISLSADVKSPLFVFAVVCWVVILILIPIFVLIVNNTNTFIFSLKHLYSFMAK